VVADNSEAIGGGHLGTVRFAVIRKKLLWPSQGGSQQASIAGAGRAAVGGDQAILEREGIALVDPDHFGLLGQRVYSRACADYLLGELVQGVAVAADDIFALFHFLVEGGIRGRELASAVRALD
jgi:hypothetical protein